MPKRSPSDNWQYWVSRNTGNPCKVDGCPYPRHRIGHYCKAHGALNNRFGHPLGRTIHRMEYEMETLEVKEFLTMHSEHPGVLAALQWIDDWMESYVSSDPRLRKQDPPGIDLMRRMKAYGVTPLDVLTTVASLWLYSTRRPSKLPDDIRLTYAIGIALHKLVPAEKLTDWRTGKTRHASRKTPVVRGVGLRIRDTVGALLINIATSINTRVNVKEKLKLTMAAPFDESTISQTYILNTTEKTK